MLPRYAQTCRCSCSFTWPSGQVCLPPVHRRSCLVICRGHGVREHRADRRGLAGSIHQASRPQGHRGGAGAQRPERLAGHHTAAVAAARPPTKGAREGRVQAGRGGHATRWPAVASGSRCVSWSSGLSWGDATLADGQLPGCGEGQPAAPDSMGQSQGSPWPWLPTQTPGGSLPSGTFRPGSCQAITPVCLLTFPTTHVALLTSTCGPPWVLGAEWHERPFPLRPAAWAHAPRGVARAPHVAHRSPGGWGSAEAACGLVPLAAAWFRIATRTAAACREAS